MDESLANCPVQGCNELYTSDQEFNQHPQDIQRAPQGLLNYIDTAPAKPYVCRTCEMSFNSRGGLSGHIARKHDGTFTCRECNRTFHEMRRLSMHRGKEHDVFCCWMVGCMGQVEFPTAQELSTHLEQNHGKMYTAQEVDDVCHDRHRSRKTDDRSLAYRFNPSSNLDLNHSAMAPDHASPGDHLQNRTDGSQLRLLAPGTNESHQYLNPGPPSFFVKPNCNLQFQTPPPNNQQPEMPVNRASLPSRPASTDMASQDIFSGPSQKPMGATAFAKLPLFNSNDPSRDLKPIRRPMPDPNAHWSTDDEDDDKLSDSSGSFDEEAPPTPPKRLRAAAAFADDAEYRNGDETDADMSVGRSPTPEPEAAADPDATDNEGEGEDDDKETDNPTILPGTTTQGIKVRRGVVTPNLNFDDLMTFPPKHGSIDPNAPNLKTLPGRKAPAPMKEVPMNFTTDPTTPHMSFIMRRAQALAAMEQENKYEAGKFKIPQKKIRRRLAGSMKPKRPYNWKTENKNKKKRYEINGFTGRARDRERDLEKQAEAERLRLEAEGIQRKLKKLNANGKRTRGD